MAVNQHPWEERSLYSFIWGKGDGTRARTIRVVLGVKGMSVFQNPWEEWLLYSRAVGARVEIDKVG